MVNNNDGRLLLTVCVGWSPWVEEGSAEAALLAACLADIGSLGWEPYHQPTKEVQLTK